ncbi:hypothetical protein B9Z51_14340 [Limnohabitans sp. T6-5]|uniref:PRC-barrel domain-containing protein n=1 Tax=Limnohabitans sp. T6-5 TaxID=1100724 RepID=UPI000D363BF6|nr:PRC-barrel domain-containing protein [Limnohabitans sp. T6-5]PUE07065.1 hypothetical protein B9Z51_14340 [Limnohabitans sp. T6-5]
MNQTQSVAFGNSPIKASNVIGKDVVNPAGKNLGDIKEIMLDPVSGKVAYAVLSFGGFLGLGEKLFAVPFSALTYNHEQDDYRLDVNEERLTSAPGFDSSNWPTMASEEWNRDIYKFYEKRPYWEI